ncbi:MAG: hypothetical protein ACOCWZ_10085 [Spirochaetota bacterium]
MKGSTVILTMLCVLLTTGCVPREPAVVEMATGQSLTPEGEVIDTSHRYVFKKPSRPGTLRDLYNHIYFQGDTLCFSLRLNRPLKSPTIHAVIRDPRSGVETEVERLETAGKRVYGFSLIGSILENFHRGLMDRKAGISSWEGRRVPCVIEIRIVEGEKVLHKNINTHFEISFKQPDD